MSCCLVLARGRARNRASLIGRPDLLRCENCSRRGCAALGGDEGWRDRLSRAYGQVSPTPTRCSCRSHARPGGATPLRRRGRDHGAPGHVGPGCTRRPGRWSLLPRARAYRPRRRERGARRSRASGGRARRAATPERGDPARQAGHCGGRRSRSTLGAGASRSWPPRGGRRSAGQARQCCSTRRPITGAQGDRGRRCRRDPQLRVADSAPVRRVLLYWSSALPGAGASTSAGPLGGTAGSNGTAAALREPPPTRAGVALFTWRTLVEHMRAALDGAPGADAGCAPWPALRDQG